MRFYLICFILSIYTLFVRAQIRADETGSVQPQPQATNNSPPTAVATAQTSIPAGSLLSSNGTQANATHSTTTNNANPFVGKPTYASFSNDIPPAYLTWKKPIPNQTFPPLYKIGVSNITFEWTVDPNILKVQPENLTVALANPQKQTYTATVVPGTATSAYWDLAHLQPGSPLMVGYYTVWVYDQRGPKAFPSPGWLMPDSRLIVALYSTEAYVPRTDSMFCPTCYLGGAGSFHESLMPLMTALSVAILTSIIMLISILR
ncbi:uncharacterized protein BX663DRAFT_561377 [Cokeromyces recurvatus]|uniref:uncharacterized protein n=1 Tax=Cokeromyces recurvatus TaxID=90255 RepID=UPI00221F7FCA|nr:uncharacterized protein BX663DRAFT_561377 [Cokeromyces recurvatus]KAI7902787.1 hypothetical protein BX663DRAFT_561377 [Cokeromyces recurvatus]